VEYHDFELLATDVAIVREEGRKRITFRVQVPRAPAGQIIQGVPAEYDAREMREQLAGWERRDLDWPDVIEVGNCLAAALFPDPVRDLLVRSLERTQAEGMGLRLRLLLEGELHNLPWEYALLNRGGGEATMTDFLALTPGVSVARHQAATMPAWEVEAELPARVAVVLASPSGYEALQLQEERQAIAAALEDSPHVQASFATGATVDNLPSAERRAHLFHFAGHGDFEKRIAGPGRTEGAGVIVLEDGYGDPAPLGAGQLSLRLRQAGVRAAVLGACRSGRRDEVNVWSSVATALLKADLGAVVGMQYTIRDRSAIAFAGALYRALAAGLPIDEAVTNGRLAIAPDDVRGWGVPVLYLRAEDGIIFPEYAADAALEEERGRLRIRARQRITELRGRATAVRIGGVASGDIEAEQVIDTVTEDGEATLIDFREGAIPSGRTARPPRTAPPEATALACPRCHAPVEAEWVFCPNCRTRLRSD